MPEVGEIGVGEIGVADLAAGLGREAGVSGWHRIDQARIDAFAALTGDPYFIHTDPVRAAAETPFGGTIAHGFHTLALLSAMSYEALPRVRGTAVGLNAGFERVRFLAPVPAGARVRGRFVLAALDRPGPGELRLVHAVTVEIEGGERPALVADWITRLRGAYPPPAPQGDAS